MANANPTDSNAPGVRRREAGPPSGPQDPGDEGGGGGGRNTGAAGCNGDPAQRQAARFGGLKRRSSEKFDAVMDTLAAQVRAGYVGVRGCGRVSSVRTVRSEYNDKGGKRASSRKVVDIFVVADVARGVRPVLS